MRTGLSLGAVTALQLVAGLLGQLVILRMVGVGQHTDAYVAAQAMPLMVFAAVSVSLQNLWLPRFARISSDAEKLRGALGAAQGQTFKLLLALATGIWLTCGLWAPWAFPGFSKEQVALVVALSGPLLAACVLNAHSGILIAALRTSAKFLRAEVVGLLGTLACVYLFFLFLPRFGITAVAWIVLGRAALVGAVHWMQAGRPGMTLRDSDSSREVWRQARPLAGAALFVKSTPLVDRYWSSQAGNGAASVLNLAQLLMNAAASIIERGVLIPVVPTLSRLVEKNDLSGLWDLYIRCLKTAALCAVGFTLLLLAILPIWNDAVMRLIRVEPYFAGQIFAACLLLAPTLFSAVGASTAAAAFYALGETRLPTVIGIAGFTASLLIKGMLFYAFGVLGLAAGSALYVFLVLVIYHFALHRRIVRAG